LNAGAIGQTSFTLNIETFLRKHLQSFEMRGGRVDWILSKDISRIVILMQYLSKIPEVDIAGLWKSHTISWTIIMMKHLGYVEEQINQTVSFLNGYLK